VAGSGLPFLLRLVLPIARVIVLCGERARFHSVDIKDAIQMVDRAEGILAYQPSALITTGSAFHSGTRPGRSWREERWP